MQIYVTSGTGEGPTPVAAFDAALINAGIANYNLIRLSSVIPVGSVIQRTKYIASPNEYGYQLYVVIARHDEKQQGKTAWAGLGWTQDKDSGCGLFVETGGSDRSQLEKYMQTTLEFMIASRHFPYGTIESEIVGLACRDKPVCALVIAVYQSKGWA